MRSFPSFSLTSLLAGVLAALAGYNPVDAQEIRYSGSLGFSSGSYFFADRTQSFSLLNGLSLSRGRLSFSATLPIIAQTSDAVAFLGGGMMPTGGPDHEGVADRHSGTGMGMGEDLPGGVDASFDATIGDPLFRGSFQLFQSAGKLRSLTAEAMAKAPLAPLASGVGTGAWDLGVRASSVMAFGETLILAGLSFWSPGDLPELVLKEYADVFLGVGRLLGRRWSLLSSLNLATAVIETIDPPASAGLSIGFRPRSGRSLNGGISVGLTEASPDLTVFLGWSFGFLGPQTQSGSWMED